MPPTPLPTENGHSLLWEVSLIATVFSYDEKKESRMNVLNWKEAEQISIKKFPYREKCST